MRIWMIKTYQVATIYAIVRWVTDNLSHFKYIEASGRYCVHMLIFIFMLTIPLFYISIVCVLFESFEYVFITHIALVCKPIKKKLVPVDAEITSACSLIESVEAAAVFWICPYCDLVLILYFVDVVHLNWLFVKIQRAILCGKNKKSNSFVLKTLKIF